MKTQGQMDIFKHRGQDCSSRGISSNFDEVEIWPELDPAAPDNAVVIIEDECVGRYRIRAVPANEPKQRWSMYGGCAIYTSNGVVPHSNVFIKLHDRFEEKHFTG